MAPNKRRLEIKISNSRWRFVQHCANNFDFREIRRCKWPMHFSNHFACHCSHSHLIFVDFHALECEYRSCLWNCRNNAFQSLPVTVVPSPVKWNKTLWAWKKSAHTKLNLNIIYVIWSLESFTQSRRRNHKRASRRAVIATIPHYSRFLPKTMQSRNGWPLRFQTKMCAIWRTTIA